MQDQTDNRRVVPDRTRKGWTAETLDRLGVVNRGGPLFVLPNGEKLYDDGRDKKEPTVGSVGRVIGRVGVGRGSRVTAWRGRSRRVVSDSRSRGG